MTSRPRVLVVQHEDDAPLGRLPLPGLDAHVVRPDRGEPLPPDTTGLAGLVVLGGAVAAWEDDVAPWLPATRDLLVAAVTVGTPTLAICLGAQLLARACGGTVARGDSGPELGILEVTTNEAGRRDPILGALPGCFVTPQGHHDVVLSLPAGAVLLASSRAYPHQAFRLGRRAWGVQYHPEVPRDVFGVWMREDVDHLAAIGMTPDLVLEEFTKRDDELVASARAHGEAFARVVRGP